MYAIIISLPKASLESCIRTEVPVVSLRDFVLTVMANVAAYYTVKCLDWFITLITG